MRSPRQPSMAFAPKITFGPDSPLEGAGFEPSVPLEVLTVGIVPCRLRGPFHASLPKTKFAADSALEAEGFEPSVPRQRTLFETVPFELAFPMGRERDRGFESLFLYRRVWLREL